MKIIISALSGLLMLCATVNAQESDTEQHACCEKKACCDNKGITNSPIGIMGDHIHHKGSFMVSYRFMTMNMDGALSSGSSIENSDVFSNYMVAPQTMRMDMHMVGAMYSPTDNMVIMLMANYLNNTMDLRTNMGMNFTTQSSGLGDLSLSAMFTLYRACNTQVYGNIGSTIPTGSLEQRDDTPMMMNSLLAYPMQLGSGTFDPSIGATYLGNANSIFWGVQTNYKRRFGENEFDYRLGNEFNATAWGTVEPLEHLDISLRATFSHSTSIVGANPNFNPMMMPLFNTNNSGRTIAGGLAGINYYFNNGFLNGLKFGIEVGMPLYQKVNGIQMKQDISAILGVQYTL